MIISNIISDVTGKLKEVVQALQGRLTLQDNILCRIITVADTGTANTEFTVTHNLEHIPTFYVWNIDKSGYIYDSQRNLWTTSTMRLKCSAANAVVRLLVF